LSFIGVSPKYFYNFLKHLIEFLPYLSSFVLRMRL
jgi:hypothetical protein